jgi:hypothetical protein
MKRTSFPKPTPAMIVAVAALIAAVGGTAYAGVATISKLSKSEKKQVRKISKAEADKRISARAATLSVAHAKSADSATSATSAGSATTAVTATTAGHAASADEATRATRADDAGAIDGVGPVRVDLTSSVDVTEPVLDAGGLAISAKCNGGQAEVELEGSAPTGVLVFDRIYENGSGTPIVNPEFGGVTTLATVDAVGLRTFSAHLRFLGVDGTVITGEIVASQTSDIAPCVVRGLLWVS